MTLSYVRLAPNGLTEAIGLLDFWAAASPTTLCVPTDVWQPVGIPAVLAALRAPAPLGTWPKALRSVAR